MATAVKITDAGSNDYAFDEAEVLEVTENTQTRSSDTTVQSGNFVRTYVGNSQWLYIIRISCEYQSTMAGYSTGSTAGKIYRLRGFYKTPFTLYPYYLSHPTYAPSCVLLNPDEILDQLTHGRAEAFYGIVLKFLTVTAVDAGSPGGGARGSIPT